MDIMKINYREKAEKWFESGKARFGMPEYIQSVYDFADHLTSLKLEGEEEEQCCKDCWEGTYIDEEHEIRSLGCGNPNCPCHTEKKEDKCICKTKGHLLVIHPKCKAIHKVVREDSPQDKKEIEELDNWFENPERAVEFLEKHGYKSLAKALKITINKSNK